MRRPTLAEQILAQGAGGCCDCLALMHKHFVEILRSVLLLQESMNVAYTGWRHSGSHAGEAESGRSDHLALVRACMSAL
jgi:hypothetical protein